MGPFYLFRKVLRLYIFPVQTDFQEQYLGTTQGSGNAELSSNLTCFEGMPEFQREADVNFLSICDFFFCFVLFLLQYLFWYETS